MLKTSKTIISAVAVVFILNIISLAQTPTPAPNPESDFVTEKGFKTKVIEVKYRDANSLTKVLRTLGSGFKGASISPSTEFKTLTVRDFPENITAIEDAVKRLDTPLAPQPNIELHMHVLVASNTAAAADGTAKQVPAELKDVLAQLSQTLSYKNYELATSIVQRLTETGRGLGGKGTAEISGSKSVGILNLYYQYGINGVSLTAGPTPTIQIGELSFQSSLANSNLGTSVQTALNIRDGEKVVVGTSAFLDRALVVIITAKVVN